MSFGLGFWAAAGGVAVATDYELISTTLLGSTTASVTFDVSTLTSYKHLQLRTAARSNRASTEDALFVRFNGDTAGNYSSHWMEGRGSSVTSGAQTNGTGIIIDIVTAASSTANVFSASVADILDGFATTKNKTVRSLCGTSIPIVSLQSGAWRNTNSVTSLTIYAGNGSLVSGSRFSLYGIKG